MDPQTNHRPQWEIERVLQGLLGENVRVAAQAFSPTKWSGEGPPHLTPVRELLLPDNSQPAGLPVYFEGRLQQFVRQIGVVYVSLEATGSGEETVDGLACFRGKSAVILRAPALVKLAFPFHVEKLPPDSGNYWRDLRLPRIQFELPL